MILQSRVKKSVIVLTLIANSASVLLLFCSHLASANPSCSAWYTEFLKVRADENKKIKTRTLQQDRSFCAGKTSIYYSQCFRQFVQGWAPTDPTDVVETSALVESLVLRDKDTFHLDQTTVRLATLDGLLLILEKTEPKNFTVTKCKVLSPQEPAVFQRVQTKFDSVERQLITTISNYLSELEASRQPAAVMSAPQKQYISFLKKRYLTQFKKNWKVVD